MSSTENSLPNIAQEQLNIPSHEQFAVTPRTHKPRILLLYGSLRERSYSRLVIEESARRLT
ncbi:arsenical resistance protein ArsH, partial [Marinomonas arenicola]